MTFQKSSPELVERFSRLLPKHPDPVARKMFGYPGSFVKGNFFLGLYEEVIVVRMPADQKAHLPQLKDAHGFNLMEKAVG